MKKKKISKSTVLLIVMFVVGLSVLLYPSISDYWNSKHATRAIATYQETVDDMSEEEYAKMFEEAEQYNAELNNNRNAFYDPDMIEGYDDILNVTGTEIMGYITIDKIDVNLPIYHGTDEGVLAAGAGHLEGTSFPIGGVNTHAVISAHRGLPSAKLFTRLDELEEGDTFNITILDRTMTYEVDKISIVLPEEVDLLQIEDGQDYVTLMTCTPYGINTHRLLVRGHRIATIESKNLHVENDATKIDPLLIAPIFATPILIGLLIYVISKTRKKGKKNEH